jgi:hypothetical protein
MVTTTRICLALGVLSLAGGAVEAGEPAGPNAAGEKAAPAAGAAPVTAGEIEALIDALVSRNPKPITGKEDRSVAPDYKLPVGFSRARQETVRQAFYRLRYAGPAAFPALIRRWGDERYALTGSHGLSGYHHNHSVGWACEAAMFDQLQPYSTWPRTDGDPRGKPKRPSYPAKFLSTAEAALKWCEARRDKSLYEMQLEVLDWVIAEEAKMPQDYTAEERAELQEIRRELTASGKAMRSGSFFAVEVEL